jgi:hypothetical protein
VADGVPHATPHWCGYKGNLNARGEGEDLACPLIRSQKAAASRVMSIFAAANFRDGKLSQGLEIEILSMPKRERLFDVAAGNTLRAAAR